jgi:hypothetical protein
MLSSESIFAELAKTWHFLELWVDPLLFPPKVSMVIGNEDGSCRIFNPAADYKLVVAHSTYQSAQDWLLEDEYERIQGQLLAEDAI